MFLGVDFALQAGNNSLVRSLVHPVTLLTLRRRSELVNLSVFQKSIEVIGQ